MNKVQHIDNHSSSIKSDTVSEEHRIVVLPSPTPPPATPKVKLSKEGKIDFSIHKQK